MEIITREEARRRGLKTFFVGKECIRGHVCEWYARKNGGCIECGRMKAREYQAKCAAARDRSGTRNSSIPKQPTIPGARLILGRCQSGSP
jgi:hypothetical protein